MVTVLLAGQAGASGMVASPVLTLVAFALAIALEALLVKAVTGSILGHPVRYAAALLTTVGATLIQYVVGMVIGLVYEDGLAGDAAGQGLEALEAALARDPLMPFGVVPFLVAIVTLVLALTVAIRTFIRSPDRETPSWFNASLSAIAITMLLTVLQYGIVRGLART